MRVKVLLLAVFAFVAMNVNGQDLKYGAKAGLNISNFGGDDANSKSKVGFHIGGFMQYGVNDALFLQPELLLSFEGAKDKSGDNLSTNITFLNIPVMVGYKIAAVQGLSVEVGPQLGFLLAAKYDGDDAKDLFKSMNLSLNIGGAYDINEKISVGLRYCMGLTKLVDVKDLNGDYPKAYQNNFQISVGYKF